MWQALLSALPGIASAAGGVAGLFGKKGRNPADASNQYLDQIPGAMKPYYQPYMDSGSRSMGKLEGEYGSALDDPNSIYNKLSSGYKESPGYQAKLQAALGAGQNASAAGGMLGTPQDVTQESKIAHDITDQDFEEYLNHMLGIYNQGISGEEGINKMGFDATTGYGNMIGSVLGQKSQNAYAGQDWMNENNKNNWSNIFGGIGAAGTGYNNWINKNGGK